MTAPALIETDRTYPDLTALQEAFVHEYVDDPKSASAAAKRAGYTGTSIRVTAHQLLRNPKVLKAITDATIRAMGKGLPAALRKVQHLTDNARSEYVQLEAAKDQLDRAGLTAPKRHQVGGQLSVTFDLS